MPIIYIDIYRLVLETRLLWGGDNMILYMFKAQLNTQQNHNTQNDKISLENVSKFKYLEMTITNLKF
jgi:hypothetical protein